MNTAILILSSLFLVWFVCFMIFGVRSLRDFTVVIAAFIKAGLWIGIGYIICHFMIKYW